MFTAALKTTKKKVLSYLCIALAILVGTIMFFCKGKEEATRETVSRHVTDNESRREFIGSFGWETEEEPSTVADVLIPQKFDEVLTKYNEIQKLCGMDLSGYLGKTVKKYTYPIKNYSGGEAFATVYVYDGTVIAADISSPADNTEISIDGG